MKFSEVLALVGIKPKTLTDATAAIDNSKATLDSVNALFTAANLPLEPLLAAGPDSLKAHLASLSAKDQELAAAQARITELTTTHATALASLTSAHTAKVTELTQQITAKTTELTGATASLTQATGFLAEIGFKPDAKDKDGKPLAIDAIKPLWKAHLSKATNIEMSRLGIPERYIPKAVVEDDKGTPDATLAAEYEKLPRGPEKQAFYAKNEQALWRHEKAKQNRAE